MIVIAANGLTDEIGIVRRRLDTGCEWIVPRSTDGRRVRKRISRPQIEEVRHKPAVAEVGSGSIHADEGREEDSRAGAHHSFGQSLPGEAHARREIPVLRGFLISARRNLLENTFLSSCGLGSIEIDVADLEI